MKNNTHMRFADASVGDKVYSMTGGIGTITNIDYANDHPILVKYDNSKNGDAYSIAGKYYFYFGEPILFYWNEKTKKKCIKKPAKSFNWSKVPQDTKVLVSYKPNGPWKPRYFDEFKNGKCWCFADGATKWSKNTSTTWKYIKLAEEK